MKTRWKIAIGTALILLIAVTAVTIAFLLSGLNFNEFPVVGNRIAIIPIKGEITMDECPSTIFGRVQCAQFDEVDAMIKNAENDPSVKAILLDINSGGGEVVASREMMNSVRNCKKPVVARIGEVGASGAYYVASAADRIVADRDSIVGSIGVIMTIRHYYGLLEKIGINVTVIKAGKSKDIGSPYREMTKDEKTLLRDMINKVYYDFISDIAENRNLSISYVENISDGSLYIGSDALDLGLIDYLGGKEKAIETAAELGGIEGKPGIKEEYGKRRSLLDIFIGNI